MQQRFLLTGATGYFGAYLLREAQRIADPIAAWSGSQTGELFGTKLHTIDLCQKNRVADYFRAAGPSLVVHSAAWATISRCFRDPPAARRVNVEGTRLLAELSEQSRARLLFVSTDLVFDGTRGMYDERDAPAPTSVYGQTKVDAEQAVLACPDSVVVRVSLLFGPSLTGRPSFFDQQVAALRNREPCELFQDEWRTPLGLHAAAAAIMRIARSGFRGLVHVGGPERMSRLEMGHRLAAFLHCDPSILVSTNRPVSGSIEPRPRDVSLDSTLWRESFPEAVWPSWNEALEAMAADFH
jgi:dTDP-4-dehydrorhamnose reductase